MDKAKLNKLGQKEGSSLAHLQGRDPYLMNEGDYAPILFLSFFRPGSSSLEPIKLIRTHQAHAVEPAMRK